MTGRSAGVGTQRLAQVFDGKSDPAQPSHEVFPAVQKLGSPFLTVTRIAHRREGALVVVAHPHDIPLAPVALDDLQADGLLMLTDVEPSVAQDARHFAVN
jgi:hypothetical protein